MKKSILLTILITFSCIAKSQDSLINKLKINELRFSLMPGGYSNFIHSSIKSNNYLASTYFSELLKSRFNVLSVEFLYRRKSFFYKLNYSFNVYNMESELLNEDYRKNLDNYYQQLFQSKAQDIDYITLDEGDLTSNNYSIGIGYYTKYKRFSFEPFYENILFKFQPYQSFIKYRDLNANRYYIEQFDFEKNNSYSQKIALKVNYHISKNFKILIEPAFIYSHFNLIYNYQINDNIVGLQKSRLISSLKTVSYSLNFGFAYSFINW